MIVYIRLNLLYNIVEMSSKKMLDEVGGSPTSSLPIEETTEIPSQSTVSIKASDKASDEKKTNSKGLIIIVLIGVGAVLAGIVAYVLTSDKVRTEGPGSIINLDANTGDETSETAEEIPIINTEESPLNGVQIPEDRWAELQKRNPIAVTISNSKEARPQSNLSQADIVIESNVEGGITRYLALYWSNDIEEVGPIRSIRTYHLEWLSGYDAILIHDGWANSKVNQRLDARGNVARWGIKDAANAAEWAWRDGKFGRLAPHNEYASPMKVWELYAVDKGYESFPDIKSWTFKNDASSEERGNFKSVDLVFSVANTPLYANAYDAGWEYDKDSNMYLRTVGHEPHVDALTEERLKAKVVIIQNIDLVPTADPHGRVILETMDKEGGKVLQDGKVHEITWDKPDLTTRTMFYNLDGTEFVFNRGPIWIEVIPKLDSKVDIITE